jgi:hypothetical protein
MLFGHPKFYPSDGAMQGLLSRNSLKHPDYVAALPTGWQVFLRLLSEEKLTFSLFFTKLQTVVRAVLSSRKNRQNQVLCTEVAIHLKG